MITGALFPRLMGCEKKIVVCQGGGDAGKTSDILKYLATKALLNPGTVITVTGQDLPNLKKGALRLFQRYIATDKEVKPFIKSYNKQECTYVFKNESILEFTGFDDEQDARGSERDYLFINECNSRSYNLFWQLQRKTRQKVLLDYNPTSKFWVHSKLLPASKNYETSFIGKVQTFRTWHIHNPFLTEDEHAAYESISDPQLYRVYSCGKLGETKGVIHKMKKVDAVPDGLQFGFGIDIGYTSDKTAIVKVWHDARKRYYKVLLYKSESEIQDLILKLATEAQERWDKSQSKFDYDELNKWRSKTVFGFMADILKENGCTTSTLVWGDHDKNYSNGLRKLNIQYRMARKGPNSVIMGISKVKECENYYIDSPELEAELETYVWQMAIDQLTGDEVTTNLPIDGMPDHALAAIRYFDYSFGMRFTGKEDE